MKRGYNLYLSEISQQEGQDQARRLYRFISDNARRLDDARGCARTVSDLFTTSLLVQRSKLREHCERLIFLDPILFGHKTEELLWKRVYYDVISTSKRLKKQDYSVEDVAHLQGHINAGIGYYHHFLTRLQLDFQLNLSGIVDFPPYLNENIKQTKCNDEKVIEWAEIAVHRCLIYLGDLNRYKLEIYPNWDYSLAIRYYLLASNYKPDYGMPHNQLGTLATSLNFSLDAVYHYMRCLCCKNIFEGTENNLLRLLEKNSKSVTKYQNDINNFVPEPTENIKRFISRFLLMIENLYFNKKGTHIHSLCHQVLLDLQNCLTYGKKIASETSDSVMDGCSTDNDESIISPNCLSPDTVFKMIIICLMCITKLQKIESPQISSVKAFLLAVYSQLIQNVIEHIEASIFSLTLSNLEPEENRKSKTNKKLRRKRLRHNSNDSDLSESELSISSGSENSEINSDASGNELSDSSLENQSDAEHKTVKKLTETNKYKEKNIENGCSNKTKDNFVDPLKKVKRMNPILLLQIVSDEGLMKSVKILCDWLMGDLSVLKECGSSSQILLKKIIQLLNLINIDMRSRKLKQIKMKLDLIHENYKKIPLPEDIILKGVSLLESIQENIDWNYLNNFIIEPKEEALFRVNKLISFGHVLATVQETGVTYSKKHKSFEVNIKNILIEPISNNGEMNNEDIETIKHNESISRGKLMKDMGQLWLAAEVQDLESRVRGRTAFSPYLVLDVDALIHYMHLAKQLVTARKFIILVPIVVLSALDELKRETIKAREAIRWLETQFRHGNRFLRAQRPQERSPIPLIKYPKKKDKDTYAFIQVIECCHFLTQQQKGASNLVTLLTGNQNALVASESREFSWNGLAHSASVNFELITTFHQKWKKSIKGHR